MSLEIRDNLFRIVKSFKIAIYARLSKEEEGKTKQEKSKSIKKQIDICRRYIDEEKKKSPNIEFRIIDELYDDGISGTTFEREKFKELIELIKTKKVNMVVTKDQSRFGREHIETDNYIERWFPEHNVRYVSVLDGVDTYLPENANNDFAPIKNWMNEMYAKNTSRTIKATKKENAKKGIWNGGEPPLGLKIDSNNEGILIIEPVGAEVVKTIFNLALKKKSLSEIANYLTKNGIPTPTTIKGNNRKLNLELKELWNVDTIKSILVNEMYIGTMVQCKTTTLSHKSKKTIYLPKEEWVRVVNKVPKIIDENTFNQVQLLIKRNKYITHKSHDYLLKGLLRCRECNHSIGVQHYNNRKNNYTICNYYRKYGKRKEVCTSHRFVYEELESLILENIKEECLSKINLEKVIKKLEKNKLNDEEKLNADKFIKYSKREILKLNKDMDKMYERLDKGIISKEQYIRLRKEKEKYIEYHKRNIKLAEEKEKKLSLIKNSKISTKEELLELLSLSKFNRNFILKIIDTIYISSNGIIDINYRIKRN